MWDCGRGCENSGRHLADNGKARSCDKATFWSRILLGVGVSAGTGAPSPGQPEPSREALAWGLKPWVLGHHEMHEAPPAPKVAPPFLLSSILEKPVSPAGESA